MMWILLWACADTEIEQDSALGWDAWADGFFSTYCRSCHSADTPDRRGAPSGVDFGTQGEVEALRESICRVVLDEETMPVGGGVVEEDRWLLDRYLGCDWETE